MRNKLYQISLLGLLLVSATPAGATEFKFTLPFGETGEGMTGGRVQGMFDQMFMVVERKTKIRIKATVIPSNNQRPYSSIIKEILAKMKAKQVDVTYLSPNELFRAKRQGIAVEPWISMTVNGQKTGKFCIYTKPGAPYKSLADLKGKSFVGTDEYLALKALFTKDGVKEPLYKFLGKLIYNRSTSQSFQDVLDGKVGGIAQSAFGFKYLSQQNPKFKNLKPFRCLDSYPHPIIVTRPGISKAEATTLAQVLSNADRDPDFRAAKWFFLAINGKFFVPDQTIMGPLNQFFQKATASGWTKEEDIFFSQILPKIFKGG